MDPKKITIIGAGHGGLASAAYTASLGHKVTIWNRSYPPIEEIIQAGKKNGKGGVIELLFSDSSKDEIWRHALDINRKEILSLVEPAESQIKRRVDIEDLMVIPAYVDRALARFHNLGPAVEDADIIRVILPSHVHYNIVDKIAEYLHDKARVASTKKEVSTKDILTEIGIEHPEKLKEIITNLDFRGDRILLPEAITNISKLKEED